MQYKSYGTTKSTPNRLARKHLRREVFMANKKMARARRKANRLFRRSLEQGE
jgi:hypothetical protein